MGTCVYLGECVQIRYEKRDNTREKQMTPTCIYWVTCACRVITKCPEPSSCKQHQQAVLPQSMGRSQRLCRTVILKVWQQRELSFKLKSIIQWIFVQLMSAKVWGEKKKLPPCNVNIPRCFHGPKTAVLNIQSSGCPLIDHTGWQCPFSKDSSKDSTSISFEEPGAV